MNIWFLGACGLTAITVVAHIIGGTPEFMGPIHESNAPHFNKVGMAVIWHWVTAAMSVNALGLFIAGRSPALSEPIGYLVIGQFLSFAAIFFTLGITEFHSALPMPQWIAFVLISLLTWIGIQKQKGAAYEQA